MAHHFNQHDGTITNFKGIQYNLGSSGQIYKEILFPTHQLNGNIEF